MRLSRTVVTDKPSERVELFSLDQEQKKNDKVLGALPVKDRLSFRIDIKPETNKETQFNRKTGMAYTPASKKKYMARIVKQIRKFKNSFKGKRRLFVQYTFVVKRPNSIKGSKLDRIYADNTSDLDNYEKPVQDCLGRKRIYKIDEHRALTGAGIIDDDRFIVAKFSRVAYTKFGEKPCIEITITAIGLTLNKDEICKAMTT